MDSTDVADDVATVDRIIATRRTCLQMDGDRDVDPAVVDELLTAAAWAPNHRRTEPWRFAAFTGDGRRALGDVVAAELSRQGRPAAKIAKARVKYLRAPLMLIVGSVADDDVVVHAENRDATAAAVQNLLLAAHARGLQSFWSSIPCVSDQLLELCGFPTADIVAAIYLGHPNGSVPAPPRSTPALRWVTEGPPDQTV